MGQQAELLDGGQLPIAADAETRHALANFFEQRGGAGPIAREGAYNVRTRGPPRSARRDDPVVTEVETVLDERMHRAAEPAHTPSVLLVSLLLHAQVR